MWESNLENKAAIEKANTQDDDEAVEKNIVDSNKQVINRSNLEPKAPADIVYLHKHVNENGYKA